MKVKNIHKLHEPRIFSKAFNLKVPQAFCAYEDCVYLNSEKCPAGALKKNCPNKSSLDYKGGCPFFYGKPYQNAVLRESISGKKPITIMITGRGTGKSAVINTQKALMEALIEPYIRAMLFACDRPMPTKIIVVGNTKDTALLLRNSIHSALESNEMLYSMVSDDTKTYIRFITGSELYIRTAGTDGKTVRGFHADVMRNRHGDEVRCSIVYIFDEACFTRAPDIINEVMQPSMQVGNVFSGIFVTSTPYGMSGEIYELFNSENPLVNKFNFTSYHNKYTNLDVLINFRQRLKGSGAAPIFNREVLGQFQSDEGLFFPYKVWAKSIDDSLDWTTYNDIERMAKDGIVHQGDFYFAVDPNRFRQLDEGDFAAYLLIQVSKNREHIRAISYGKYLMDIEDKFLERVQNIIKVFNPKRIICCGNSAYITLLRSNGINVIPGSNTTQDLLRAMSLAKLDMIHGIYKQPSSKEIEDERSVYIPKEVGLSLIRPDHVGQWGQGYTSDIMDCMAFCWQQIIADFGLGDIPTAEVVGSENGIVSPYSLSNYQSIVENSLRRLERIRK